MERTNRLGLFITLVVLLALPFVLPNSFYFDLAIRMGINAVVVLALNLLVGHAGQISLGHVGFLGIGAYASAILPTHYDWHPLLAMAAGAVAAASLAALIARPIFKLKGLYLAMATLGLGMIIYIILLTETTLTGGPDGMVVPPFSLAGLEISGERQWYWLVALLLFVSIWSALNLIDSPFGRGLRALRGSEVAAHVAGVNTARYKMAIFVISATMTSVMGSVTAHYIGFVTPGVAEIMKSIELLTMVVVGGMASIYGSILGAVLLTALPEVLAGLEGWNSIALGCILILFMIFIPRGLVPTLAARFKREENDVGTA